MFGDMNFYDRNNDIWFDEKIKENFLIISKKKYVSPMDYYIQTKFETLSVVNYEGILYISIGKRKVKTIILNIRLTKTLSREVEFIIYTKDKDRKMFSIDFGKENIKKNYDGTSTFTIDVTQIDCNEFIETTVNKGHQYIKFNNLTLEFEENFLTIDYKSYKNAISNYIKSAS
jgi:lipopolysaccharide export LptBFGC system permease protein LptF